MRGKAGVSVIGYGTAGLISRRIPQEMVKRGMRDLGEEDEVHF